MKLSGLGNLHSSMRDQSIDRYKFNFTFNNVKFDVMYFIDEKPNILAFGIVKHNYYFEIPVKEGFYIKPFLEEYSKFCKIMGFKYQPDNPFRPSKFFEEFNGQIPSNAKHKNVPKPHQIAVYRNDVEESEKIYFVKWRDNTKAGHQVSPENLEKTRKLLSYKAYLRCKKKNISSCWSVNSSDENKYYLPV
ncbi:DUF6037 family protein [Halobacillus ihumii]|uniref:DUF6037 family protein n=1 Tax=Halobacillus ihumii TaxID=2686092 RepID=UPI001F07FFB5|nr:DUF6037 family protein [Halobacillus ihumii]